MHLFIQSTVASSRSRKRSKIPWCEVFKKLIELKAFGFPNSPTQRNKEYFVFLYKILTICRKLWKIVPLILVVSTISV